MLQHSLTKKERHRQTKVSRGEPYARASDEALIAMCSGGGMPVLKQSVSVPERSTKSETISLRSNIQERTMPPQEPVLSRSFSSGYNVIPNSPPVTSYLDQPYTNIHPLYNDNFKNNSMSNPVASRLTDEDLMQMCLGGGTPVLKQSVSVPEEPMKSMTMPPTSNMLARTMPPQEPALTRSFSAGYNVIPNSPPVTSSLTYPPMDVYPLYNNGFRKDSMSNPVATRPTDCGVFTFRPLEGRFVKNTGSSVKMTPYCKVKIGDHRGKTSVAKSEGTASVWSNVIALERCHCEEFAKIKVKNSSKFMLHNDVGVARIPLGEIASQGKVSRWYPIYKKDHMTGQVHLDIDFEPRNVATHL